MWVRTKNQEENASKLPSWEILVSRALSAAVVAAAKAGEKEEESRRAEVGTGKCHVRFQLPISKNAGAASMTRCL